MDTYLEAIGLEKSYRKKKVVHNVSIKVRRGEIVGLLGPNGAGKTTTFGLILGHIPQDAGKIYLDGKDITDFPMYLRARKGLRLLPQEPSSFRKLSVGDNILAVSEILPDSSPLIESDVMGILNEFGLGDLFEEKAVTLSGGERRRLEIARALTTNPGYILLDEPFTGIDPLAIFDLQKVIFSLKERGIGLLITDHSVRETLKITDRAYIMDKGEILIKGTPEEVVHSKQVKSSYLGEEFRLE
ncbi:MAG: LPS export ABC transporter ATP-binding protein [Candidatus Aminicenantes bacterium]|nr:LPS export ABC transporter ATP-binding protein [Candidatus Aminicenantes bacterium]